jgi:exopolyphosphatase / guanosine-5'-triphosphate,3'-diphosphate pyrophosphatase
MRLGVLDIGSNTGHLLVVDADGGAAPLPAFSYKQPLRLAEHLDESGAVSETGIDALTSFTAESLVVAEDKGCEDILAFATSAVRDSVNADEVLDHVHDRTGVRIEVLSGEDEARLTFLAVRRWFGWSAGRLLVLDIGGGSLEVAAGLDASPDMAASLPLGAGRLTRERLPGDPPDPDDVRALRKHIRTEVARLVPDVTKVGTPDRVVGTSKTIRSLARVCGAAASGEGPYVTRVLERQALGEWVPRLAAMSGTERASLPGVSAKRSNQLLAGALVAGAAMDLLGVDELQLCPWALREGVILRRLDSMTSNGNLGPIA